MTHDVVIAPPDGLQDAAARAGQRLAPAILQRSDDDFLQAVLEALRTAAGRSGLHDSSRAATRVQGVLKLFQPIQRQFHVALMEAFCDQPGRPRLDPKRVHSAGLVIRRVRRRGHSVDHEGWMSMQGRLRGWLSVGRLGREKADPVPGLRVQHGGTGIAHLDRPLRALSASAESSLLEEQVVPMFLAPPDVCQEAGKTLFYGLVPTTSAEIAEGPVSLRDAVGADALDFGPADAEFRRHLMEGLRGDAMALPLAGETLHPGWFDAVDAPGTDKPGGFSVPMADAHWDLLKDPASDPARSMRRFIDLLRQVAIEFDLFTDSPAARQILSALAQVRLPMKLRPGEARRHVPADQFLAQAHRVLLLRDAGAPAVEMPESWPALADPLRRQLHQALHAAMTQRFAALKGAPGRYDEPGAQYVLRAFVREKPTPGCPGHLHWSDYSEPFVIAPWYEGSGAPPAQIPLPDVGELKGLKPSVAFVVPPSLQGLMGSKLKDLLDGKKPPGGGITWICGFSLPVITICAFICLNIFLSLFNLIFQWMLFIKICIPFPKR